MRRPRSLSAGLVDRQRLRRTATQVFIVQFTDRASKTPLCLLATRPPDARPFWQLVLNAREVSAQNDFLHDGLELEIVLFCLLDNLVDRN